MVPKVGDVVDLNPLFKQAYNKAFGPTGTAEYIYGEAEDGHIHVVEVYLIHDHPFIQVGEDYLIGYEINDKGFPVLFSDLVKHGFPPDGSLFIPINEKTKVPRDLRVANTKLGTTACASCGGPLKNPMPGILAFQHCPTCEP